MRIKSSVGLAVGPVDEAHWGQVLVLPNAYGIVEIDDEGGHAQQLGVAALSFLGEQLSRDVTSLKQLESIADRVSSHGVRTVLLLVPVGLVTYIVLRGSGAVYVKRGSELARLMHEHGGISGEARSGDTFLLASKGFSQILSHDELSGLFDHLTPPDIAEKLTLLLHEKTHGEGSVALVFGVSGVLENELSEQAAPGIKDKETDDGNEGHVSGNPSVLRRIRSAVSRLLPDSGPRRLFFRIRQYVNSIQRQPNKLIPVIVICAAVLFITSVILGIWKQVNTKKNQATTSAISQAQHAFDEGVALIELNPVKGRERLSEAKQILEPIRTVVSPRSQEGRTIAGLYKQITDNLAQAMQIVNAPAPLFYDASLLKKGATADAISLSEDTVAIYDATTGTVYQLNITSKNAQIIGGGAEAASLRSVSLYGDKIYGLSPAGVIEFRITDKKQSRIISADTSWGAPHTLVSFGGNLYILDTQKSRIWKYVATENGFSEIREYLNPDTLPDLSSATGMVIDGSVWIGTANGKILRFTQGKENTFLPKGVEPAFGSALTVYVSDRDINVYVLDKDNSRVVVLDKDGMYLSQYRFEGSLTPTALAVSEKERKIFLVSDGKIYAMDLK